MNAHRLTYRLFVIFLLALVWSCNNDDPIIEETIDENRLESIAFGSEVRYNFGYFNKFIFVQPQVFSEGRYQDAGNGLEITNFDDIKEIRFSSGRGVQGRLFLRAIEENGQLVQVQRAFESGATYTYKFEYGDNEMRIVLEFDPDGELPGVSPIVIEFGDYFFDGNGNITELLKYRNFDQAPTEADLYEQSRFTYDSSNNNWKDMMLFFFGWQTLPDSRFFSNNNIVSVVQEVPGETPKNYQFQYLYDEQGRTFKAFVQWVPLNPDGLTETFTYEASETEE